MAEHIEAHLILAKGQSAKALERVIDTVLTHPHIFVFGEFLDLPNIAQMDPKWKATLELFAFGTYQQYTTQSALYVQLKPAQLKKLKLLSIAEISSKENLIMYDRLMQVTAVKDLRELEDMIIECLQAGLLRAKLDQRGQKLHV